MNKENNKKYTKIKEVSPPNNLPIGEIDPVPEEMLPAIVSQNLPAIREKEEMVIVEKKLPAILKKEEEIKEQKKARSIKASKDPYLPAIIPQKINKPAIINIPENKNEYPVKKLDEKKEIKSSQKNIPPKKKDIIKNKEQHQQHHEKNKIFISEEDKKKIPPIIISKNDLYSPKKEKISSPGKTEKQPLKTKIIPTTREDKDGSEINLKGKNENSGSEELIDPDDINSNFRSRLRKFGIN